MNIKKKDLIVLSHFRRNARCRLTTLSRTTGIPVSTLFDKLHEYEQGIVQKTVALLNFGALGFSTRANVIIKAGKERDLLKEHLLKCPSVNSLYKINNGFDYLAECIFKSIKELEDFVDNLRTEYSVKTANVYYIVDELKREEFLADPSLIDMLIQEPARAPSL